MINTMINKIPNYKFEQLCKEAYLRGEYRSLQEVIDKLKQELDKNNLKPLI